MQSATPHPWMTAGVALVGTSVIAVTPVASQLTALPDVQHRPVQLTDTIASDWENNVLAPIEGEPAPAVQQLIVNQAGYLAQFWHDITNINSFETDLNSLVSDFGNVSGFETTFSQIVSDLASFNFGDVASDFSTLGTDFTNYFDQFSTTFSTIGTDITNYFDQFPNTVTNIVGEIESNAAKAVDYPISIFMPSASEPYILHSLSTDPFTIGFSISGGVTGAACTALEGIGIPCSSTTTVDLTLGNHADLLQDLVNGLPVNLSTVFGTAHFGTIPILTLLLGSSTADIVRPWLDFAGSPLSGVLVGAATTLLSPVAALLNDSINAFEAFNPLTLAAEFTSALATSTGDLTSAGTELTDAFNALLSLDFTTAGNDLSSVGTDLTSAFDAFNPVISDISSGIPTALNDLVSIPGDMFNDFFVGFGNAATLVSDLGIPTLGVQIDLGGLLSPAGSAFNIFGFDLTSSSSTSIPVIPTIATVVLSGTGHISDAAAPVGPLASLVELGQSIAFALGWDGTADQLGSIASLF